jgi:hypothetical protein
MLASFKLEGAPIATVLPSSDSDTDDPYARACVWFAFYDASGVELGLMTLPKDRSPPRH